jgi:hypothetical protein
METLDRGDKVDDKMKEVILKAAETVAKEYKEN